MLRATDRHGNTLFAAIPHHVFGRLDAIGSAAFRVLAVLVARAHGDGAVDAGEPVSLASLADDAMLPLASVRKALRRLRALEIIRETAGPGKPSVIHLSTGYFLGRSRNVRGTGSRNVRGQGVQVSTPEQVPLPLDVILDVESKEKAASASPPASRKRFRTAPTPTPETPSGAPPFPWVAAVRAGLNGTAGRRPDVAQAVLVAVRVELRKNPRTDPAAMTRAVEQYCRTIVDRGLFPAVSPFAYLPAAIAGKADRALEDRLEAEALARREELARERRKTILSPIENSA